MSFPARRELLEQMLRDGQLRRAPALSPPSARPLSTGVPALDSALGGGLLRGQLHELVGPPGAGGTALIRAALAAATCAGETCALIDPGKPWQNGTDESFNGKFRDECLSVEWFRSRREAVVIIEAWRRHYNQVRPHSSLDYHTPVAFRIRYESIHQEATLKQRVA